MGEESWLGHVMATSYTDDSYKLKQISEFETWCADHGIQHSQVHSATIKKFATGSGRGNKDAMRAAGAAKFRPTTQADDEIDALWILEYALAMWGKV